jgi:hypothetical protein
LFWKDEGARGNKTLNTLPPLIRGRVFGLKRIFGHGEVIALQGIWLEGIKSFPNN